MRWLGNQTFLVIGVHYCASYKICICGEREREREMWLYRDIVYFRLADYIVFDEVIKHDFSEPQCVMDSVSSVASYDHIPGVSNRHQLQYSVEAGLTEVGGLDREMVLALRTLCVSGVSVCVPVPCAKSYGEVMRMQKLMSSLLKI